jgi:hypothetical protein
MAGMFAVYHGPKGLDTCRKSTFVCRYISKALNKLGVIKQTQPSLIMVADAQKSKLSLRKRG